MTFLLWSFPKENLHSSGIFFLRVPKAKALSPTWCSWEVVGPLRYKAWWGCREGGHETLSYPLSSLLFDHVQWPHEPTMICSLTRLKSSNIGPQGAETYRSWAKISIYFFKFMWATWDLVSENKQINKQISKIPKPKIEWSFMVLWQQVCTQD